MAETQRSAETADDLAASTLELSLGNVNPHGDQGTKYEASENVDSIWTDYLIVNRYEIDRHICMMPIASPTGFDGNEVAFVQLAALTTLWICDWTAKRINREPTVPAPESIDPDMVLLDMHFEPDMITVMDDGRTPVYRLSGTYVYGSKRPSVKNVHYGRPSYIQDQFNRKVDTNKFRTLLHEQPGDNSSSVARFVENVGTTASPGSPGGNDGQD